jgi:hypothetical protein
MSSSENPRQLQIAELQKRCMQETHRFMQGLGGEAWHCYEIFRRAVVEKSEGAWQVVDSQYRRQLRRWVEQHPRFLDFDEEADLFVNLALEKFWKRDFSAAEFSGFPNLKAILAYLKTCVASAITDFWRHQQRVMETLYLDEIGTQPALSQALSYQERLEGGMEQDDFWAALRQWVDDEAMFLVLYESFVLDMKPVEIFERHVQMFDGVRKVYRLKAKALMVLGREFREQGFFAKFPIRKK